MDGTLRAAIIDDEPLCIDQLKGLLLRFDCVRVTWELGSSAGLMDLLRASPVDLLFLDINIQQESGFAIAEYINRNFPEMMIVFTTGFEGFAVHGYAYEPLDFLTKPVNELRLEKTLSRALARRSHLAACSHTRTGFTRAAACASWRSAASSTLRRSGARCSWSTAIPISRSASPCGGAWRKWRRYSTPTASSAFTSPSWCPSSGCAVS